MLHCPSCAQPTLALIGTHELRCPCGFHYFHNVAAAVMVALCWQDEVLVAVRAREPGQGMWDLPGGFVDPDESLEQAVQRELHEELGWQPPPESVRYLGSFPNTYRYDNITYKTCDTVFVVTLSDKPVLQAADDVAALYWVKRSELELERFAFPSTRNAITLLTR